MAQGDKCGNCERSLATLGCATNICVASSLPPWQAKTLGNRISEVDPNNENVCQMYLRAHHDHGGGND